MGKYSENYNIKQTQRKTKENLNSPKVIKQIELVVKNLPITTTKKFQAQMILLKILPNNQR